MRRINLNAYCCDSSRVYHTSECRAYKQLDSSRRATDSELERLEECDYCSGDYEPATEQARSLRTVLADGARNEL